MTLPLPDELAPSVAGGKVTDVAHVRGATPDTDERLGTLLEVSPAGVSSRVTGTHRPVADVNNLAALRAMMAAGAYPEQVRLKCHTSPGVGGGVYVRCAVGSYVDDNGATIVDANWAYVLPLDQTDLRTFGADPTGVALCDVAVANYMACVVARDAPVWNWGAGTFSVSQTVRFQAANLVGLIVRGVPCAIHGFGVPGTTVLWRGTSAAEDVIALEQSRQQAEDFAVKVAYNLGNQCRCMFRFQAGPYASLAMTAPRFRRIRCIADLGGYVDAIAICPDAAHQSENNYENGILEDCFAGGFSHAHLANYNVSGQAKHWLMASCSSSAYTSANSWAADFVSGSVQLMHCTENACKGSMRLSPADVATMIGGASEYTEYAYSYGGTSAPLSIHWGSQRRAQHAAATSRQSIVLDGGSGPRLWTNIEVSPLGGDARNIQAEFTHSYFATSVVSLANIFPTTDPFDAHDAYGSYPRVKIECLGTMGHAPLDYLNPATTYDPHAFRVRSNQSIDNPWIFGPSDPECHAFFTAGPRVLPQPSSLLEVLQWRPDSPASKSLMRAAGSTGRAGIILKTKTGGKQVEVDSGKYLSMAAAANCNPGAQSFLLAAVVRLAAIDSEQCILGKCDFGGVTANNWQCLVTAAGKLQLAWGNDTANRYTASTAAILHAQTDYLLVWGLDRATSEVVYVVMREVSTLPTVQVERHAVTITDEVYDNAANVFLGCNTANALPSHAYFTHWSMYVLETNADPEEGISLLSDRRIKCIGDQMVREFSL